MLGKDVMRDCLQCRWPWGPVRWSAWHCGQQVKNIHNRLRKITILWRCTGAGAPAFSNPTSKILCIKGNTVLLLATCQIPQFWLFSLFVTFIYSSFFSFPIHCLSSCSFACPSARRLPLSDFLAPFPLTVLLQRMQRWRKYVLYTGHCNVALRKKGKEVIVPFKKWAVIMLWVKMK